MKAILEFNLPEDKELLDNALMAENYKAAFFEIWQEVFRPARKHGYRGRDKIENLLDGFPHGVELIGELEKMFLEILEDRGINLD